jgi:hypothetical protein
MLDGAAGEAGKSAWATLSATAGRLLGRSSVEATALAKVDEAAIAPQTHALPEVSAQAAQILVALAQRDHAFAELLEAWRTDPSITINDASTVTNTISGNAQVKTAVQVQTVNGGIRFGD